MKKLCYLAAVAVSVLSASCSHSPEKSKATSDREQWKEALSDSVVALEHRMSETTSMIDTLRLEIEGMLPGFVRVDDPRLVEGYAVCDGWQKYDTGAGTGIVARVLDNERMEIVASLSGGVFDRIEVASGDRSVSSASVPYDAALNYRAGNVNIVAFSGKSADSIGMFVAENSSSAVELRYYGRTLSGKIRLSDQQKKMLADTWRLVSTHEELNRLERSLPLYSEKIRILKSRFDADN